MPNRATISGRRWAVGALFALASAGATAAPGDINMFTFDADLWDNADPVPWSLGTTPDAGEFVQVLSSRLDDYTLFFGNPLATETSPFASVTIGAESTGAMVLDHGFVDSATMATMNLIVGAGTGASSYLLTRGSVVVAGDTGLPQSGLLVVGKDAGSMGRFEQSDDSGSTSVVVTGKPFDFRPVEEQGGQPDPNQPFGGYLLVGSFAGATGTYTLTGLDATLDVQNGIHIGGTPLAPYIDGGAGFCSVGSKCIGTFEQSGGVVNAGTAFDEAVMSYGGIDIGAGSNDPDYSSRGTYRLSGGQLNAGNLNVGLQTEGLFEQSGGSASVISLLVGNSFGSQGQYDMTGGSLAVRNAALVGVAGTGVFTQSGAESSVDVGNQGDFPSASNLVLGLFEGSSGTYNLVSGRLSVDGVSEFEGGARRGRVIVGQQGAGTLNVGSLADVAGPTLNTRSLHVGGWFDDGGTGGDDSDDQGYQGQGTVVQDSGSVNTESFHIDFLRADSKYVLNGGELRSGFGSLGGGNAIARFEQHGGLNTNTGLFIVANTGAGPQAFYKMDGGTGSFNDLWVGGFGYGQMDQSGGTVSVSGELHVGDGPDVGNEDARSGVYNLSGSGQLTANVFVVGAGQDFNGENGGIGRFTQSGMSSVAAGFLVLGEIGVIAEERLGGNGRGFYTMEGGTLTVGNHEAPSALIVGQGGAPTFDGGSGGVGVFEQTGGSVTVHGFLTLGDNASSSGQYTLSDGELKVFGTTLVGNNGTGTFTQAGGTLTTDFLDVGFFGTTGNGTFVLDGAEASTVVNNNLVVGNPFGNVGLVEIHAGTMSVNDPFFGIGIDNGTLDVSGGSLSVATSVFVANAAGPGILNQSGGSIDIGQNLELGIADGVLGTVTQSGGSLNVHGNVAIGSAAPVVGTFSALEVVVPGSGGTGSFTVSGTGSTVVDGVTTVKAGSTLSILGGTYGGAGQVRNNGVVSVTGGSLNAASVLNNADFEIGPGGSVLGTAIFENAATGTVRGQGTIAPTILNHGLVLADDGVLAVSVDGQSGTVRAEAGSTIRLMGNSDAAVLDIVPGVAGAPDGTLDLNGHTFTVDDDFTNDFGQGNAFFARANVVGDGLVLAGGLPGSTVQQTIIGDVIGGDGSAPQIRLVMREGESASAEYGVKITGTTGPLVRGAIQTGGVNANLSSVAGFGGSSGPTDFVLAAGQTMNTLQTVSFSSGSAGQTQASINVTNNFDNVQDQLITVTASVYATAIGNAESPVVVANQRVGGMNAAAISVLNAAALGEFSEDLDATIAMGGTTGAVSATGSVLGLKAGATNAAGISVGVDTATAGEKTGSVTLDFASTGTVNGVANGLAPVGVGSQIVNVTGKVYQLASGDLLTTPLNFGTVQVGQTVTQTLSISNVAAGALGFVEDLNARFGAASGTGASRILGQGSINGLLAGSTDSSSMRVDVDTTTAGVVSGAILVNYFSAGAVGGTTNGLGELAVGSDSFAVTGSIEATANVINQASPRVNNPTINLGPRRVGDAAATALVSVSNVATVAPQAALDASIASDGSPFTATGSFSGLAPGETNASSLMVGLSTATSGDFTGANAGSATISFVSNAANVGDCAPNCELALPSQDVSVSGKVYQTAQAQLVGSTVVDFGTVRVGGTASTTRVVRNAATGALVDMLTGSLTSAPSQFSTNAGALASGIAGNGGSTTLGFALNTATAGVFSGSATASFKSHNADMDDLSVGSIGFILEGTVNNLAAPRLSFDGGNGSFSQPEDLVSQPEALVYLWDFGTISELADTIIEGEFRLTNAANGPADDLDGTWDVSRAGDFQLSGFGAVDDLAAGRSLDGLFVRLDTSLFGPREFDVSLLLDPRSVFGGILPDVDLRDIKLRIVGRIRAEDGTAVPAPAALLLLLAGMLGTLGVRYRMRA